MGFYRLFLAYMVVQSHVMAPIHGRNFGVTAVISFLLLSGFVMTALIRKYYLRLGSIPAFYLDRFIRLAPQFYLYSSLTLFCAIAFDFRHNSMTSVPSAWQVLLQFLVVPLNFYRHFPQMLLPQAWSLGLEAMFYAIFPIILIFRIRMLAAGFSFAVFLAAYTGLIDTDLYGYRYLPGTMFIFLCGSWLESADVRLMKQIPFFICMISAALLALTYYKPQFDLPYNRDVLVGLLVGIPIVFALKVADFRSKTDELAGDLSYGVFLCHNFVIAGIQTIAAVKLTHVLDVILVCSASTLLSYVSFELVEKPLIRLRRSLRGVSVTWRSVIRSLRLKNGHSGKIGG